MSSSMYAPVCSKPQIKRYPDPPPPPDRSKRHQMSQYIVPVPEHQQIVSNRSSSCMYGLVGTKYGEPQIPPPHPWAASLLESAASTSGHRQYPKKSPNGAEWALHNRNNSGLQTAAHKYYRETAKRAEIWTGARTKTQQRRDRKKEMRIKKYKKLKDLGWDVPTTGAGRLRREQNKKAKLKLEMDMMREFMGARLFGHRPRAASTTEDGDHQMGQLVQLNLHTSS